MPRTNETSPPAGAAEGRLVRLLARASREAKDAGPAGAELYPDLLVLARAARPAPRDTLPKAA